MKLYGLIGFLLSHSLSKKYFDEKFRQENLFNYRFSNFEISHINQITDIIQQNKHLQGFAITIPYKQQIIPYLHIASNEVKKIQACNCVKIIDGQLYGYNTDIIGFEKSFTELLQPHHNKALILGTGGAAKAVQFVLKKLSISFLNVSRKIINETTITYQQINQQLLEEYTIIINTTPLGTFPNTNECPDIPYQLLTAKHYLFDLIYNPSFTKFLQLGKQQNATIKNGKDMLTIQAEENWKIWYS
ncbi:MAG: shikimate dehydrogenase [Chitinophagaceae bacterium]|nr:shikimate dehydrogenase [Chitinophagaceae bacterium]MCW5905871.1 shikimate dehydrogenase [Chitinophagaceae bacterium]